jgi:diaminohydroxyphosphoribosylaminopyrimidine deaminase/5-amino-6-(5-phosphoribosylamino)uracil reductase
MVGIGTVLADDPELTCRIPGFRSLPLVRVVADSRFRTPPASRLATSARTAPIWVIARNGADAARRRALADLGVVPIDVPGAESGVDPRRALQALAERGITRLLVEGGGRLAASLLRAGLVDRLAWFHAPAVMGGDGWPAAQGLGVSRLADMPRFVRHTATPVGPDLLSEFERVA